MKKTFLIVLMSGVLVACGSVPEAPVKDQAAALNAKQLCCEDFKTISYEALVLKTPKKAILDPTAPARQFAQGRSYFRAFSIPAGEAQGIWIKSYFNGILIKQYLQPLVLFLDADRTPLGISVPRTQFREGNMFDDGNARMQGGVRVPPGARYLLVFTTAFNDAPDPAVTAPSTGAYLVGNTPVITTNPGKSIPLERSVVGELSLELEDISK